MKNRAGLLQVVSKFVAAEVTRRSASDFQKFPPSHVGGYVLNGILKPVLLSAAWMAVGWATLSAQTFDSGSDGSYGPMNITSNTTLALPADGVFKCTSITVATGVTLRFTPNALNTPVYLLATTNVTINGSIDVSGSAPVPGAGGAGGPGGFSGGNAGAPGQPASAGVGPGAGRPGSSLLNGDGAGSGSYSAVGGQIKTNNGSVYGSPLLVPIMGGSGGGGCNCGSTLTGGGGGGGGAIAIASNTRIDVNGNSQNGIYAQGGPAGANYNGGSGGAIRLVAPTVAGTGRLDVQGSGSAGDGRIRIDALNRSSAAFFYGAGPASVSVGAFMAVAPSVIPRLDILEAAGTPIPLGTPGPVTVLLPFGSTTNRTVTVRAQDFGSVVPINVVLTPDQGNPIVYSTTIDNFAANPATNVVNVVLPVNVTVKINAWTK